MEKKAWLNPEFNNLGIESTLGNPDSTEGNDDVYVDAALTYTYKGKVYTKNTEVPLGLSV